MAIALVSGQNVSASGTSNPTSAHFNNTVTAGNAILVAIVHNDNVQHKVTSVTDSAGSVYASLGALYTANSLNMELWGTFNATSTGSATQTVQVLTYQTADLISFIAQEFSGFTTTGTHFDAQANISSASATSVTTGNITTNNASEILLAIGAQNNTNRPYTAGSGYSIINQLGGTAGIAFEYQIISTSGSYNAAISIDIANPLNLALFAISSSAIGGGAVVSYNLMLLGVGS